MDFHIKVVSDFLLSASLSEKKILSYLTLKL